MSASSWLLDNSGTWSFLSLVIFQHSFSLVTYRTFPSRWSLSDYSLVFHSFLSIIEHLIVSSLFETKQRIKKENLERTQTYRLLAKYSCSSGQQLVLKAKIGVKYTGPQIHHNSCGKFSTFSFPPPCVHFNFSEPKQLENIFYVIGW